MSLPSARHMVFCLTVFCTAFASGTTFAHLPKCGEEHVLPPDFVEVREKLIQTMSDGDISYYEKLLAPGFEPNKWHQYLRLTPVETNQWAFPKRRRGSFVFRDIRGDCHPIPAGIWCASPLRPPTTNRFREYTHDRIGEHGREHVVVLNVNGAESKAAPNVDAPPLVRYQCGDWFVVEHGAIEKQNGIPWLKYTESPELAGAEWAYIDARDLAAGHSISLKLGAVLFRRIGGLWRIVGFGEHTGD